MNMHRVGWADIVAYFIIVCVMVAGFAYIDKEREGATITGRRILCTGIVANVGNVARDDPFVVRECRAIGVDRNDYPPTTREP